MQRKSLRSDTQVSLNEEVLSGEGANGPTSSSVVITRGMAAKKGPDLEVANFRRRYKDFIHPSSVSSLRKNYPESIRAEYRAKSTGVSLSEIRRANALKRDYNAERAKKKRKVDAVA